MEENHSSLNHQSDLGSLNDPSRQYQVIYLLLGIIALVIFVSPRFIHLDADPRPGYIPGDVGYQIDEGYKTFAPKNLLVFGKTIWHPSDNYRGWMKSSPVTQWPYYFAFKTFGLELKNARMVSAIYFALFMALTFYFLTRRYGLPLAIAGVLLLASESALFYFSRSSLFETAMILFVYTGILLTTRIPANKPLKAVAVMMVFMLIATYTIKRSAIIYYAPPIVACSFLAVFGTERSNWRNTTYITALALTMLSLIFVTRETWLKHIDLNIILNFPKVFLLNAVPDLSPLSLLLGFSCILHLLLVKPESLFNNIYRLSLVAIVVGGPVILSLFEKHPPRYFVTIIPACLLLTIEWLHLKPWILPIRDSFTTSQKVAIAAVFITFSMLLLRAFEILILRNLPITIGEDPGIDKSMLYKLLPLFVIGLYIIYHLTRSGTAKALGMVIPIMATASIATGVYAQTLALLKPSYESQIIRSELNDRIADTESIAGDWAAFFTAEAPIHSFYMSKGINFPDPDHIDKIRPDYFLSSDTPFDKKSLDALESNAQIQLSDPRVIGTYMDHDVSIFRINYLNDK